MPDAFFSERFYYTWGPHPPSLRIESGETVRIICPDSDSGLADGTPLPPERRQPAQGTELFAGNPLAGPIHVSSATKRDSLAVTIDGIELDRQNGATLLAPAHGLLSQDFVLGSCAADNRESVPNHLYQWRLDPEQRKAHLENPLGSHRISVPLRPMIGCLGVCPTWGQAISSLFAGPFGGNLDLPLIESGATVLLPVLHDGGLLFVGDLHAAQGAGEIVGGGIETSGIVMLTVRLLRDHAISSPRILAGGRIYTVATDGDLRTAVCTAYSRLIDWLAVDLMMSRWDAYQLVSQASVLEMGGLSVPNCLTVAAGLPLELLPQDCRKALAGLGL